jgi:multiple sugar transport system substrate-binding protein
MSASEGPLLVLGRAFDGFSRALTRQLGAIAGETATFELPEILELQERVLTGDDAVSGRADLLMVVTDWLPALIETGKILPLDGFFAELPPEGWPDAWHPALRELQQGPDGRTYGVPYHVGPQMLLYRADLYEDPAEREGFAGRFGYPLAAPDTWAQFRDQARWFTRPDRYGTIVAGYPDEHNTVYDFLTQLWSRSGELTGEAGQLTLDTPQARAAAGFLCDLWHTDGVVDPAAAQWDSVASGVRFAAGDAALMVNWSGFAAMSAPADSPTHGLVRCAPVPRFDGSGGRRVALNSYWVLAVAAGTSRPQEAPWGSTTRLTEGCGRISCRKGGRPRRSQCTIQWRSTSRSSDGEGGRLSRMKERSRSHGRTRPWLSAGGVAGIGGLFQDGPRRQAYGRSHDSGFTCDSHCDLPRPRRARPGAG